MSAWIFFFGHFINKTMVKHLTEFTVEELKKKAVAKKVPQVYKMNKAALVKALRSVNAKIAAGYKKAAAKKK